jgi:hypothetical protein
MKDRENDEFGHSMTKTMLLSVEAQTLQRMLQPERMGNDQGGIYVGGVSGGEEGDADSEIEVKILVEQPEESKRYSKQPNMPRHEAAHPSMKTQRVQMKKLILPPTLSQRPKKAEKTEHELTLCEKLGRGSV